MVFERESDGTVVVPVNMYTDVPLMRFLVPDLVIDAPGDRVFATGKSKFRGRQLTFQQSQSGYNMSSVEGVRQVLLAAYGGELPAWWAKFAGGEYVTQEAMFRQLAIFRVMRRAVKEDTHEDEFFADVLLMPMMDRLQKARTMDPALAVFRTVKIIRSFLTKEAFATYKPRYREKLLALSSKFYPFRKDFMAFEIDTDAIEDSMYLLLYMFS